MSTPHRTRPATVLFTLAAMVAALFVGSYAASASSVQSTTTTVTVTPGPHAYGAASVARAVVRDSGNHARPGSIKFYVDSKAVATVALNSINGTASTPLSAGYAVGRHAVTAVYVPTAPTVVASSQGARAFDVIRATPTWSVSIPRGPIFGGNTALNVTVHGPIVDHATVALTLGGKVIQKLPVPASGLLMFRPKVTWNAGSPQMVMTYSGNGFVAPSSRSVIVTTAKAASSVTLTAPASLGYAVGGIARVVITSAGTAATGVVTLLADGRARSSARLSGGAVSLSIPALGAGTHTLTVTYAGDVNHGAASGSRKIVAASTPCPATARACVDLTHSTTWLQSGGRITYGPVTMASGRPGYRSDAGTFSVYWKDINHHSSEFNNASMPYSDFFDGGIAFHEGSIYVASHGCIHLTHADAVAYWNALHLGDQVYVFGYAPY